MLVPLTKQKRRGMPMYRRILILAVAAAVVVLVPACNDDDCPTCPGATPRPTMANIWPHADGTAWTFEGAARRSEVPLPVKAAEVPTMDELHAALAEPIPGIVTDVLEGLYRMELDGMITTESGATGQKVVQTFFQEEDPSSAGVDPLLALVARARPDLRPAIAARCGLEAKDFGEVSQGPYFLGGYCFSAEEDGYYGYGDIDQDHSWVYLAEGVAVGTEFSLQLVPALADDVWLTGKVWSLGDRTVSGVDYANVLEVMYLVDMGMTTVTDETGNLVGTMHPYIYGHSFFVPDLGPVAGVERRVLPPLEPGEKSPGAEYYEYEMDLVGVTYAE
jgi:hypothetical protein